jgi:hypothetical protein
MKHLSRLSRRGLLGRGLAAGAACLTARTTASGQGRSARRVLALIGDRYHNPDYIRVGLNKAFTSVGLKADYTIQYDAISHELLNNYQLLVILRDGMIWPTGYLGPNAYAYERGFENSAALPEQKAQPWITEEPGAAIKEFVSSGKGLYAVHNSSHISLSSKDYREVMGVLTSGIPPSGRFRFVLRNTTTRLRPASRTLSLQMSSTM